MQQWLFVAASGQQFSANEPDLPALVQSGQITDQTLMWREGMAQWMPASAVFPTLFTGSGAATQPMAAAADTAPGGAVASSNPVASTPARSAMVPSGGAMSQPEPGAIRRLVRPLHDRKGWIKFVAIMTIIGGVASAPFLIGLVFIFAGVALLRSVGQIEHAHSVGDPGALEDANRQVGKFFFLQGVFMAVYLALVVAFMALFVLGMGAGILSGIKGRKSASSPPDDPNNPQRIEDIRFPDSPPPKTR